MFGRVQLFVTPWTAAGQAPLSMEFPKQIHLSWFPCPPPGDLPDPGIEPMSSASPAWAGRFFATVPLGKPSIIIMCHLMFYQRTVLNISWKNSRLFESVWIVISAFFLKLVSILAKFSLNRPAINPSLKKRKKKISSGYTKEC